MRNRDAITLDDVIVPTLRTALFEREGGTQATRVYMRREDDGVLIVETYVPSVRGVVAPNGTLTFARAVYLTMDEVRAWYAEFRRRREVGESYRPRDWTFAARLRDSEIQRVGVDGAGAQFE